MRDFKIAKFSLTQNFEENANYLVRMHEENWILMCDPLVVRSDYSYILYHHYRDVSKPEGPYREPGM